MATKVKDLSPVIEFKGKTAALFVSSLKRPLTAVQKQVIKNSEGAYDRYQAQWKQTTLKK